MYVYISFSDVALIQGRPTFFSRGPNLLFQKFRGPKFSLTLSSSQTKVFGWISWWSPKKKGLHSDLIVFFCQKLGEDQKKRSSLRFWSFFSAKKQVNTHTKKRSFRWILWDFPKSKYKRNSRTHFCNSQRQRESINQPTDAETFGAGHLLDPPALIDGFRSSVYQKLTFLLAVTILPT